MKRILAWILAVVMMVSLFPMSAFANGEVYIEDTYVYDCMRGADGKFHQVMADVVEPIGRCTYQFDLNSTCENASGTFILSDEQETTPWEAGQSYPVTYNGDQVFYVEVLENFNFWNLFFNSFSALSYRLA